MSLAVHAPTQFVSAESHASVCVHEQFIFFFNQRLLMRKKQSGHVSYKLNQ